MDVNDEEEDVWDEKSFKLLKTHLRNSKRTKHQLLENRKPSRENESVETPIERKRLKSAESKIKKGFIKNSCKEITEQNKARRKTKAKCSKNNNRLPSSRTHFVDKQSTKIVECNSRNYSTPVKNGPESCLDHCPKCQMPFRGLHGQSPQWHVVECLDEKHRPIGSCPHGSGCSLSNESHFKTYSHSELALRRSRSTVMLDNHDGKAGPSRQLNFSDENKRLEANITYENEESSCSLLIDHSESKQPIHVDDDSDLDLFGCYEFSPEKQKTSATVVSNGASDIGGSTIESGEEIELSLSRENNYSPRQVSEAELAKKYEIAVGSETNSVFINGIHRKHNNPISDQQVAMLPCTLEPNETSLEMDIVEGKTKGVSVKKSKTSGFSQHSVLNERNINEGKNFRFDNKCSGIPGMASRDKTRVSHHLIIDEISIAQEENSKIQNKCLGINEPKSVESHGGTSPDIDNVKLHTLGNVDENEDHTWTLYENNMDKKVESFVCDSSDKKADVDYGYVDAVGNEEVAFYQQDRAYMMNGDDETMKSEENEMFCREYECSEDGKKQIEYAKATVNKIENMNGLNLFAQQSEIEESDMFNATEAHIEKGSAFAQHLHSRKKINCKTEGQAFYFDTQFMNCSESSDSSLSRSQELQSENPDNFETYTEERNAQNKYFVESNDETFDDEESSPKDVKPLMLTCIKDNVSNNSKVLKQQDIGVYFGLKPQHGSADKIKLQTSNKSSGLTVNDVLRDRTLRYHKGSKKSDAKSIYSSDQELSSGNTDTLQSSTANKKCPFYKKIPGTPFTVDAFRYGIIAGCKAYFLSHFHYDHYGGLTKNFSENLFCSKITANLVQSKLRVNKKNVTVLPMYEPVMVEDVETTLLDANHCPGAVMFLFKLRNGRVILHTGDFRASPAMENYPALTTAHIHTLYLDTTYCDPQYTFPPQEESIQFAVTTAVEAVRQNPKTLVVCGSYTIGKERVFMSIAEALGVKVSVARDKKKILDCLESDAIRSLITTSWSEGKVHVLPMASLTHAALSKHLKQHTNKFNAIVAFKPTGWEHKTSSLSSIRPSVRGSISIFGVPYSEHSSYNELERFVKYLRPDKIIPTVNVYSASRRSFMADQFNMWLKIF